MTHVEAIDMMTGRVLGAYEFTPGRMRVWYGHIFCLSDGWYALSWDGLGIRWERVLSLDECGRLGLIAVFASSRVEGFLGVTAEGDLYESPGGTFRKMLPAKAGLVELRAAAEDGNTLLLVDRTNGSHAWCVELPQMHCARLLLSDLSAPHASLLGPVIQRMGRIHSLPWRFGEIIGEPANGLTLISRRGHRWRFELARTHDRICLRQADPGPWGKRAVFQPPESPAWAHYQLRRAQWRDGSQAWIDSRGLLHLKSSDAAIPEVSFVLFERDVAGWSSDGRLCPGADVAGRAGRHRGKQLVRRLHRRRQPARPGGIRPAATC